MAAQITVDVRSFIIGMLVGAIILVAIGWWHWDQEETPLQSNAGGVESDLVELAPDAEALDYAAQFEQQQKVEDALQKKAQSMLDAIIGKNRSVVRVSVSMDFNRRTTETSTVEPGTSRTVLSEETSEKNSAETTSFSSSSKEMYLRSSSSTA